MKGSLRVFPILAAISASTPDFAEAEQLRPAPVAEPDQTQPEQAPVPVPPAAPLESAATTGEQPGADTASCEPECRAGFTCVRGECVSACNPPCPGGQTCNADAVCIASPQAAAPAPAAPVTQTAAPLQPSEPPPSHKRRSASLSAALGPSFVFVSFDLGGGSAGGDSSTGGTSSNLSARGTLVSVQGRFQGDLWLAERVGLGFNLAGGRIQNSDDSSGSASLLDLGPVISIDAGPILLGGEFGIALISFDDVTGSVDGYSGQMTSDPELDGESITALYVGAKLGFPIRLSNSFSLVPEMRARFLPGAQSMSGSCVLVETGSGGFVADAQAFSAFVFGLDVSASWDL